MKSLFKIILPLSVIVLMHISGNAYCFDFRDIDMDIRAGLSETYDDNITSVHENEKEDFITNLSFGLGAKYEGKTRSLELAANIIQQLFANYDNFNNTSQDVTLSFRQELSKYDRISLKDVFTHTYEPRSFEDAFGRATGRYSYYRNKLNLAYTKDIAKQLSVTARYANEIDEISREDLSDSSLNKAGLEATYFPSSATILMFSYDFSERDFDPGDNATTHTIAGGLRHYLTSQLYFDGRAGLDLINSYDQQDYTKPLIQASLTNDIDENTRAGISFAREYYTNAYSEDLFDYWHASASLRKQLFKRLGCSLSAFYGEGEYIAAGLTDKLRGASIGFTYDLRKNLKGTLNYSYSNVDSTINTREYTRNSVLVGIKAEF